MRGLSLIQPVDPAQLDKETHRIYGSATGAAAASISVHHSTRSSMASTGTRETWRS